jgi:hypothetical protein
VARDTARYYTKQGEAFYVFDAQKSPNWLKRAFTNWPGGSGTTRCFFPVPAGVPEEQGIKGMLKRLEQFMKLFIRSRGRMEAKSKQPPISPLFLHRYRDPRFSYTVIYTLPFCA